jgi:hypothetical protein
MKIEPKQQQAGGSSIGEHFREIPTASKERIIELLSDGELQLCSVNDYSHWDELLQSCKDTISARKNFRFSGRRAGCADLLDAIMQHLRKEHHVRAPKCWLFIIRKLRNEDGGLLIQPRDPEQAKPSWTRLKDHVIEVLPEGILSESFSPLNFARGCDSKFLKDLEPMLIERARRFGVPKGWDDAVSWLDSLIAERSDLASRLSGPRERMRQCVTGF